jgi:hypothetical protein
MVGLDCHVLIRTLLSPCGRTHQTVSTTWQLAKVMALDRNFCNHGLACVPNRESHLRGSHCDDVELVGVIGRVSQPQTIKPVGQPIMASTTRELAKRAALVVEKV